MKKILYMAIAATLTLSSCDMDVIPEGSIPDTETLQTVDDYSKFATGLNAMMRSVTSGDYVILSDIQFDDFHAVIGNGNRRMDFYNGQMLPSTGEISSIYSGYYSAIAQCNFLIQNANEKIKENLTPDDAVLMQAALSTAYFYRAYCYSGLADKFCQSYKNCADRDKEGTGLSLQLRYEPTAENDKYPGRSSLTATYNQIVDDLLKAEAGFKAAGDLVPSLCNATTPTEMAAKAMLARVYLNMGEDTKALECCKAVIGTSANPTDYKLIRSQSAFRNMWLRDEGTEVIWLVSADYSHTGSASGIAFCNNDQNPDYIPTNDAMYIFEESDVRWGTWFDNPEIPYRNGEQKTITNSGGSEMVFLFCKYPGNPLLQPSGATGSNFINMPKPLRLGEIFLIAAEASYNLNDEATAREYLKEMDSARSAGCYKASLTGTDLIDAIRNERHRELMGEGMRQADLKRWNIGFTRSDAQDGKASIVVSNNRNIQYTAGDYRLTWPIPQHELDANPQIVNQQNPGY